MLLRFGEFELDGGRRLLLREGREVALAPKPYALLSLLVERRPEAVSKEEILERIWGPIAITEGVLTTAVGELRHSLGESAQEPRFLRTVHRFGYAFAGEVIEVRPPQRVSRGLLVCVERRFDLFDGEFVLGRHGEAEGDIRDPSVSRHHARLLVSAGGIAVEDLESKNGTWVNGEKVESRAALHDGDELRLGTFALVLRLVTDSGETETVVRG